MRNNNRAKNCFKDLTNVLFDQNNRSTSIIERLNHTNHEIFSISYLASYVTKVWIIIRVILTTVVNRMFDCINFFVLQNTMTKITVSENETLRVSIK